jgi:hypothetical protein
MMDALPHKTHPVCMNMMNTEYCIPEYLHTSLRSIESSFVVLVSTKVPGQPIDVSYIFDAVASICDKHITEER